MMGSNERLAVGVSLLEIILQAGASAQMHQQSVTAHLCDVVASSAEYNGKVLLVEGILSPSEHSLALYSPSCKPKEGSDVTIQAVFATSWESESGAHGKQLQKLLRGQKNARVRVSGTFESGSGRYGPDVARFRFVIRGISSVEQAKDTSVL